MGRDLRKSVRICELVSVRHALDQMLQSSDNHACYSKDVEVVARLRYKLVVKHLGAVYQEKTHRCIHPPRLICVGYVSHWGQFFTIRSVVITCSILRSFLVPFAVVLFVPNVWNRVRAAP